MGVRWCVRYVVGCLPTEKRTCMESKLGLSRTFGQKALDTLSHQPSMAVSRPARLACETLRQRCLYQALTRFWGVLSHLFQWHLLGAFGDDVHDLGCFLGKQQNPKFCQLPQ